MLYYNILYYLCQVTGAKYSSVNYLTKQGDLDTLHAITISKHLGIIHFSNIRCIVWDISYLQG